MLGLPYVHAYCVCFNPYAFNARCSSTKWGKRAKARAPFSHRSNNIGCPCSMSFHRRRLRWVWCAACPCLGKLGKFLCKGFGQDLCSKSFHRQRLRWARRAACPCLGRLGRFSCKGFGQDKMYLQFLHSGFGMNALYEQSIVLVGVRLVTHQLCRYEVNVCSCFWIASFLKIHVCAVCMTQNVHGCLIVWFAAWQLHRLYCSVLLPCHGALCVHVWCTTSTWTTSWCL